MSLTQIAVKRPITTLMIFVALIFLGFVSLSRLSIDFLPDISVPSLTVKTIYPYASPGEVELTITEPIESRLSTVSGVKKTSSISREGVSLVTIDFQWGVNIDYTLLEVREKLDQLKSIFPSEAKRPTILRVDPSSESMMTIVITKKDSIAEQYQNKYSSKTVDMSDLSMLKEFARSIVKRRMEQIDGVAMADVTGGVEREIHVNVNKEKAELYRISFSDIENSIKQSNVNISGGTIKQGYFKLSLRTIGEFLNLDDIRLLVIRKNPDGSVILLKDIAEVVDGYKERTGVTHYNGKETISLLIHKEAGANTVKTSKLVHEVVEEINKDFPNLQTKVVFDQAEFISKSLSDVESAILQGAFLAFIILFLFLKDFRSPIIIGFTMPISMLITFIMMDLFKVNINIISLTGLALGIGMLGDNAIVIIENATRLRESGYSRIDAAIEGGKDINLAAAVSTFTNVAIFIPVLYVEGIAKELFKDMALTMTFSLLASLLTALMLVPMLISREIRKKNENSENEQNNIKSKFKKFINHFISNTFKKFSNRYVFYVDHYWNKFRDWFDIKLEQMLIKRKKIILIVVGFFIISIIVAYYIPSQSTPEIDQQRFTLEIQLPKGSSLEAVVDFVNMLETHLLQFPEVDAVISRSGIVEEQSVASAMYTAHERATIEVKIKEEGLTQKALDKVRNYLAEIKKNKTDINVSLQRRQTTFEQILKPEPYDLKLMVSGKNLSTASTIADSLQNRLLRVKGIVDLQGGMQKGNPEYKITIDREKCALYEIPLFTISKVLQTLSRGSVVSEFSDFDRKTDILLKTSSEKSDINSILEYKIDVKKEKYPLKEFLKWERSSGFSEIWRENQNRVVLLTANVKDISISKAVDLVKDEITNLKKPEGYTINIGGENEEINSSFKSLFIILLLSLVLVYMLLAMEFESLKIPLVIILTSPLAFMGAIFTMVLVGESYNLMSLIGIVIMVGAVDNDAVIAIDFIIHLRKQGLSAKKAIHEGMTKRLRSIIMTTATTILGVIPLLLSTGESSSLAKSLSYPVVGGLFTSTIFTLIAIPVIYSYLDKDKTNK